MPILQIFCWALIFHPSTEKYDECMADGIHEFTASGKYQRCPRERPWGIWSWILGTALTSKWSSIPLRVADWRSLLSAGANTTLIDLLSAPESTLCGRIRQSQSLVQCTPWTVLKGSSLGEGVLMSWAFDQNAFLQKAICMWTGCPL